MIDITSKLKDINPTDRVYSVDGKFVKVRIVKRVPPPGSPSFGVAFLTVSGSETDKDGRAIVHEQGWRIATPEVRTVLYDQEVQLGELLETIRQECVQSTLQASNLQNQIDQHL